MKIEKTKKKPVVKQRNRDGSYVEAREKFLALTPLNFKEHPESFEVLPLVVRPYISKVARESGLDYLTLNLGDGTMLVLRYSLKDDKRGDKLRRPAKKLPKGG